MAFAGSGGAYYRSPTSIPDSVGLKSAYTIHCFVKSSVAPGTARFAAVGGFVGGDSGAQRPQEFLEWHHTNAAFYKSLQHRNSAGSYVTAQMASTPSINTWHSVAGTFDGNARVYLDGALSGTSAASSVGSTSQVFVSVLAQMTFGGLVDPTSFTEGEVAEFAIWNTALSADEIAALAKGFRAKLIRPLKLQYYSPLVRSLEEIRGGRTLVKQAGTDLVTDHPRVFG